MEKRKGGAKGKGRGREEREISMGVSQVNAHFI